MSGAFVKTLACRGCVSTLLSSLPESVQTFGRDIMSCCRKIRGEFQEGKNSLKIKLLGRIFLGYQGPRRRDIPDASGLFLLF